MEGGWYSSQYGGAPGPSVESLATTHDGEAQEAEGRRKPCIPQSWCLVSGCILVSSHDIKGNLGVNASKSGGIRAIENTLTLMITTGSHVRSPGFHSPLSQMSTVEHPSCSYPCECSAPTSQCARGHDEESHICPPTHFRILGVCAHTRSMYARGHRPNEVDRLAHIAGNQHE